ncbi:MAG: hypothetical protein P8X91_03010 [Candidatus Bathyarchaeota archaeon]|jgi:hypothetical protein
MVANVISLLLVITVIVVIYYWLDFFCRKGVQVIQEEWYIKFQKAFPIADTWMVICALFAIIGLLTEQEFGLFFTILAASSMIFLALMDITFNFENKMYHLLKTSNEMKIELAGNIWLLFVGITVILFVWTRMII